MESHRGPGLILHTDVPLSPAARLRLYDAPRSYGIGAILFRSHIRYLSFSLHRLQQIVQVYHKAF